MDELQDVVARWIAAGRRVALATVINVEGSAPRGEGAKMAVSEDGTIAGSVSGGCVESAVAHEALEVLEAHVPRIVRYDIDRATIWEVGLSCGGAIDVFIEPLPSLVPEDDPPAPVAVCTIVRGPQGVGRKMRVTGQAVEGSLGDTSVDAAAAAAARRRCETGTPGVERLGEYDVFVDVSLPQPRLLLVGAVHIAEHLCAMAARTGFRVSVIDPRPALCNRERFPDARDIFVRWPDEVLAEYPPDAGTYVAILAHDEKFDDPTLLRALPSPARYVGAIGSKKTQVKRRERLLAAGLAPEHVARLHGPIGLDIGARTPAEIAVSILAEMIAARSQRSGVSLRDSSAERIHA
jgi:xanthine dehydrogenase accessory factor